MDQPKRMSYNRVIKLITIIAHCTEQSVRDYILRKRLTRAGTEYLLKQLIDYKENITPSVSPVPFEFQ